MNVMHSHRNDDWMTPIWVLERVRAVLGVIDLDPASSEMANERVKAAEFFTEKDDSLSRNWTGDRSPAKSIFLNPPGGKVGNKSKTGLFWQKLMRERANIKEAIFLCFSIEAMQSTQGYDVPSIATFPFCVPARRIAFDYPGPVLKNAPSHSNAIVYVPGKSDRTSLFEEVFRDVGVVVVPR